MSLATTCPQCKTSFKVVPDQLKLRRGLVRCGVCQHVFSGIDSLRYVDERPAAPAPLPDDDEALDAAHESPLDHDDEPPDSEFFEPTTGGGLGPRDDGGDFAPHDAWHTPPDGTYETARDGSQVAAPDGAHGEAAWVPASDRFFDVPDSAVHRDDEAGSHPIESSGEPDPGHAPSPEGAPEFDSAAAPGHGADGAASADDSPDAAPRDDESGVVEHYDITAARGWPHDDADLPDETTEPSDEASFARDGGPAQATPGAAASFDQAGAFTVTGAASHDGGATTGLRVHGSGATTGAIAAGADGEQDAIDFFAPQRRVRGFSSRSAPLQWVAACLLVAALVVQLVIGARHWIAARAPDLEPLLAAAAGAVGLTVDPPRELDALTIESFELQASGVDKLFALVAHLRNRADHVVHWPAMELSLTDSAGTLVARKVLMPADYLGTGAKSPVPAGIGPGAEVPVRVALEVPGLSPSGYTVNIFYP